MTLNEGLEMVAALKSRINELSKIRNESAARDVYYGSGREVVDVKEPVYSLKKVDKMINKLSKDLRLLTSAIKKTNAGTAIIGYANHNIEDFDLGELEDFEREEKGSRK